MLTFCSPIITINPSSILCHTDFCGDSVLNVKKLHIACTIQNIRSSYLAHPQAARSDMAVGGQGGGYDVILQVYRGVFDCSVRHVASWVTNTKCLPFILISVDTSWLRDASSFSVTQLSVCVTWIQVILCAETCGMSASRTSSSVIRPLIVWKQSVSGRFSLFMVLDNSGRWSCWVRIAQLPSPRAVVYHTLTSLADRSYLYLVVTRNTLSVITVGQETDQKCTK